MTCIPGPACGPGSRRLARQAGAAQVGQLLHTELLVARADVLLAPAAGRAHVDLEDQHALEAADEISFDEYLQRYFEAF